MPRRACLLVIISLALSPDAGHAQEAFTIQLKELGKGGRQKMDTRVSEKMSMKLTDGQGTQGYGRGQGGPQCVRGNDP